METKIGTLSLTIRHFSKEHIMIGSDDPDMFIMARKLSNCFHIHTFLATFIISVRKTLWSDPLVLTYLSWTGKLSCRFHSCRDLHDIYTARRDFPPELSKADRSVRVGAQCLSGCLSGRSMPFSASVVCSR
jgi:hypothetical protein